MAKTITNMIKKTVYTYNYPKKTLVQLTLTEEETIEFDKLRSVLEPGKILPRVRVLKFLLENYHKNNTVNTVNTVETVETVKNT